MIYVGVTGWGDQDSLYGADVKSRDKLSVYASFFPTVEIDSSFYAIQPLRNMEKWVKEVPDSFRFIVKAYQGMTGHNRGESPFDTREEMFHAFKQSIAPLKHSGKLAMVLFQFPPWFDCNKNHVDQLRVCRELMEDYPIALEFRHRSWFSSKFIERTLQFMEKENWIHSICDEPQVGSGSVPTILQPTNSEATLVRFHGRNIHGWRNPGHNNWREVRYLYRYNEQELSEWVQWIKEIQTKSKDLYIVFNNNSGGDAADNAKQLLTLLNIEYSQLAPRQLDLF